MEQEQNGKQEKKRRRGSALLAASMGRSATAQVSRHSGSGLANTGTNISYEGATAPGAGGSVGTGYASGKDAVDEHIHTNSDYEQNRGGSPSKAKQARIDENRLQEDKGCQPDKGSSEYWQEDEMRRVS